MIIAMRQDLVAQGLAIPANNTEDFYSAEEVANMEFLGCLNELGNETDGGLYYRMKTKDGTMVHLFAVDLDIVMDGE